MKKAIAELKDFADKEMLSVEFEGMRILLVKGEDGSISALEDCCSHADFRLSEGSIDDGEISCPAHGARFNIKTGKNLCLPAVKPVRTYGCEVFGDHVFVDLPE